MPRSESTPWTVLVYDVADACEQQRILLDFHTAALGGVVALGTQADDRVSVVLECRTEGDRWLVQQVVEQLSPSARLVEAPAPATDERPAVVPGEG